MTTKAERIQKMAELRVEADKLCSEWTEIRSKDNEGSIARLSEIEAAIDEKTSQYNQYARTVCYDECIESGDAMLEACRRIHYVTISGKATNPNDGSDPEYQINTRSTRIDLLAFHKFLKGKLGKDSNWIYIAQKLNYLMTAKAAESIGATFLDVNDSYEMHTIAKEIDLGKTPLSNTSMLKTLQTVINAMIGEEYKARSHDVNFIKRAYHKKSKKALALACASHREFSTILQDVCHAIICKENYTIESKEIKTTKA